jgi:hypothetical protein
MNQDEDRKRAEAFIKDNLASAQWVGNQLAVTFENSALESALIAAQIATRDEQREVDATRLTDEAAKHRAMGLEGNMEMAKVYDLAAAAIR